MSPVSPTTACLRCFRAPFPAGSGVAPTIPAVTGRTRTEGPATVRRRFRAESVDATPCPPLPNSLSHVRGRRRARADHTHSRCRAVFGSTVMPTGPKLSLPGPSAALRSRECSKPTSSPGHLRRPRFHTSAWRPAAPQLRHVPAQGPPRPSVTGALYTRPTHTGSPQQDPHCDPYSHA